jgi:hypothetical protein
VRRPAPTTARTGGWFAVHTPINLSGTWREIAPDGAVYAINVLNANPRLRGTEDGMASAAFNLTSRPVRAEWSA